MTIILTAIAILAVLGILFGAGLAVSARIFHVETDPRLEEVAEALPGINCGACGYPGCDGYAAAVIGGEKPDLCIPGGPETALAVAHVMGVHLDSEQTPVRAFVRCQGDPGACPERFVYDGIEDCRAAQLVQGGPKQCEYGCLGFGECARACPFDAIEMSAERLPSVNKDKCTGCGACVRACPRGIIELVPETAQIGLACCNLDAAKAARQACKYACIKCRRCVKAMPEGAVEMRDNLPRLCYDGGHDFVPALDACPMKCFVFIRTEGVERPVKVKKGAASS